MIPGAIPVAPATKPLELTLADMIARTEAVLAQGDGPLPIVQEGVGQQWAHRLCEDIEAVPASEPGVGVLAPEVLRTGTALIPNDFPQELLVRLVDAMIITMREAPGVGLAGPQIGVPLRIAVMEDEAADDKKSLRQMERTPFDTRVIINAQYEPVGHKIVDHTEGCLSVDGWYSEIGRHHSVRITGRNEAGRRFDEILSGWPARIAQHEIDHLDGRLCHDLAQAGTLDHSEL